jgi:hypothetical protein
MGFRSKFWVRVWKSRKFRPDRGFLFRNDASLTPTDHKRGRGLSSCGAARHVPHHGHPPAGVPIESSVRFLLLPLEGFEDPIRKQR